MAMGFPCKKDYAGSNPVTGCGNVKMSAALDYGIYKYGEAARCAPYWESANVKRRKSKGRKYKERRREKVSQFYCDFPNCYYCDTLLTMQNRSLDHFVPRSKGGSNDFANLVTACQYCNNLKGSEIPSGMETMPKELIVEGKAYADRKAYAKKFLRSWEQKK